MANYIVSDTDMHSVANSIRTRGGTSGGLTWPDGFAGAVDDIPPYIDPVTISFWDWGHVYLGSIQVERGSDATVVADAFAKRMTSQQSRDYDGDETRPFWVDDETKPLSYKKGYSFIHWMKDEDGIDDSYGKYVNQTSIYTILEDVPDPINIIDLTSVTQDVSVKAGYTTNTELIYQDEGGDIRSQESVLLRRYSLSWTVSRVSSISSWDAIDITVKRNGVPKMKEGLIRIKIFSEDGDMAADFRPLSGADTEHFRIHTRFDTSTVYGGTASDTDVDLMVLDSRGIVDVLGATTNRGSLIVPGKFVDRLVGNTATTVFDLGSHQAQSHVARINEVLEANHISGQSMADITLPSLRRIGIPPNGGASACRKALASAYGANDYKPLTYDQMFAAAAGTPFVHAEGMTLTEDTLSLPVGSATKLTPVFIPTVASFQSVHFTSDNTNVRIDRDGTITGIAAGTSVITATAVDGGFTATCTVTVTV